MTSYTIPFESPRRRVRSQDLDPHCGGQITPRNRFAMSPPRDRHDGESPDAIKGRKLTYDEDANDWKRRSSSNGSSKKLVKSSLLFLLFSSLLHIFLYRTSLTSYITENRTSKEYELDAWSLLQKDVEALRRRDMKREARRRENRRKTPKKYIRRNRLAFVPLFQLRQKPLNLQIMPSNNDHLQYSSRRVFQLESTSRNKEIELQPWLYLDETNSESEDEPDVSRSQTVVYDNDQECVPTENWQTTFHVSLIVGDGMNVFGPIALIIFRYCFSVFKPTCNSVHELDASDLLHQSAFHLVSSKGFWRNAWRVNVTSDVFSTQTIADVNATNEFIVLKSLK